MTETFDRFDYVLTMLANELERSETGIVFLLGAGCSCQYGLPIFRNLLIYIWKDCYGVPPEDSRMEVLRENLDKHWQTLGPKRRLDLLQRCLKRVRGDECPGYRRFARICKLHEAKKLKIRAIINMNFDTLLEDALDAEGVKYKVVASFEDCQTFANQGDLVICKPHGSIKEVSTKGSDNVMPDLILDIANSELFARIEEQTAAQELLGNYDAAALGYSGVDSKIATSLRDVPVPNDSQETAQETQEKDRASFDRRDKKLFYVNPTIPDSRLFLAITRRESQHLMISGEEASFENFMEQLEAQLDKKNADRNTPPSQVLYNSGNRLEDLTFMTRAERAALQKCLRLALRIRASINVADRSEMSIEEHGTSVYKSCQKLAEASGVCLSPPERYVLYAVAFLHDLGYFQAYSDGTAVEKGWQLLDGEHGEQTAALLEDWLPENDKLGDSKKSLEIVPETYNQESIEDRKSILGVIKFICRFHPSYDETYITQFVEAERARDKAYKDPRSLSKVKIGGCDVSIRVDLLQALFASAEELAKAHPWEPSADTLKPTGVEEDRRVIEDPVLDLYLRKKRNVVKFEIEWGRVVGSPQPTKSEEAADWLLAIVDKHIRYYEEVRTRTYINSEKERWKKREEDWKAKSEKDWEGVFKKECAEWEITFHRKPAKPSPPEEGGRSLFEDLLRKALEKELEISLLEVRRDFARDLEALRSYGESTLGEICADLSRMGLHQAVINLRIVQRALTLLVLPDMWHFEFEKHLEQARDNIKQGSVSISDTGGALWYGIKPLLMALEPDEKLFLMEREGVEERRQEKESGTDQEGGTGQLAWSTSRGPESEGRKVLNKIKETFGGLGYVVLYGFNDVDEGLEKSLRGWIDLPLGRIEPTLDELRNKREFIIDELAKSSRSLLASALAIVESVQAIDRVKESDDLTLKLGSISEKLRPLVSNLGDYFSGEIASVLDLVAIYSLSVDGSTQGRSKRTTGQGLSSKACRLEPRVRLAGSQIVASALDSITSKGYSAQGERPRFFPHQGLLHLYLPLRRRRDKGEANLGSMERHFLDSFDQIIYPAWRFFAKKWHDGVEPVLMARICLDLGSSRFRSEVVGGLNYLMRRVELNADHQHGCGHNGCTLCTSRLLYIFAYSCKLFPGPVNRKFAEKVGQLLRFMISRKPESLAWKGSDGNSTGGHGIQSSDYLAWAARAVAFCFSVHDEIQTKTGESWLQDRCDVNIDSCRKLLAERWNHLFNETSDNLLSRQGEEPHSFILGHVALALLDLEALSRFSPEVRKCHESVTDLFKAAFGDAYEKLNVEPKKKEGETGVQQSLLSRLYSWPAGVLHGKYTGRSNRHAMVALCLECIDSEIWIREGRDAGSWGYNIKNSQTIITSLITFWRHAFEEREVYAPLFEELAGAKSSSRTSSPPAGRGQKKLASTPSAGSPRSSRLQSSSPPRTRRPAPLPEGGPG